MLVTIMAGAILGPAPAQVPASGPTPGSASVRLEDWGRIATAASRLLDWKVGVPANAFPGLTFSEAAGKADALGVAFIEGFSTQNLSPEIPKKLDYHLAPGEVKAVQDRLRALNLGMPVYFTATIGPDESSSRKLFEFAKALNVETIVSDPAPESLAAIDKLANEFGVNVALYNGSPKSLLSALEGRSKRIGVCADIGAWVREGIQPLDGLALLKDRLIAINLGNRSGATGLPEFFREMYRLGMKPSFVVMDLLESFEKAVEPVMVERVAGISRTAAIRSPDKLAPEARQAIESALPRQAPAKPKQPRKLLVMDLNVAYPGHRSIPEENLAIELMGKRTGAYDAVFSNDLDNLKYDKIGQFDAVFLNNTVGMIFLDPEVRAGLLRFVREGGGLAGNHGVSHASMDWPEFGEMIGTWHGTHREATELATVKIDDPNSPLTAAFGGREFEYHDEYFRFPTGPYSRAKLHVLLSVDVAKTDMNQGRACAQPCVRADNDYAVSWIQSYGKGRTFFLTLGHNPTLFTTPALAQFVLAGIQFILGDLEADTTPSAKLATAPRSRHQPSEIEPLLAKAAVYEYGLNPDAIVAFSELVEDLQGYVGERQALETRLLQFLQSNATLAGKETAFKELALIGTEASIPVLTPMLTRAETAEMARYALAAIPGAAVDDALRRSLGQAPNDRIKIGIVNSLGHRQDTKAVPALAALVPSSNSEVAAAAVAALANIADRPALDALAAARSKASSPWRDLSAEAYVACADRFAARGEKAAAVAVYKQMLAPGEPGRVRTRALVGLAAAEGRNAVPALIAEIESKDPAIQTVATQLLNGLPGSDITRVLMAEFPKVPAFGQAHLLAAMANRGDASARPAVLAAVGSGTPAVRAAALAAIGKLGDESSVKVLAEAAAAGEGLEQSAARRGLYTLRGPGIDAAIIAELGSASGKVKLELITAVGERVAVSAADALTREAQGTDPDVRREALRALRNVGGAGQAGGLLDVLLKASSVADRRDAALTLGTVLRRAQPAPIGAVISAYHGTTALQSRLSLLDVMGQVSSEEALPLLRETIRDADPEIARGAILALTAWNDGTPLMDLLNLAQSVSRSLQAAGEAIDSQASLPPGYVSPNGAGRAARGGRGGPPTSNIQVLALRGCLKLMVLPSQRTPSESGRLLSEAMAVSTQTNEKLSILSLLPSFPSQESLAVAQAATRDPAVANEAKVATAQVTEALRLK
jgi:type 1 glutamine amidotransferase/HEAT repeat protein/sugar phosphate isomerase/epimerase